MALIIISISITLNSKSLIQLSLWASDQPISKIIKYLLRTGYYTKQFTYITYTLPMKKVLIANLTLLMGRTNAVDQLHLGALQADH